MSRVHRSTLRPLDIGLMIAALALLAIPGGALPLTLALLLLATWWGGIRIGVLVAMGFVAMGMSGARARPVETIRIVAGFASAAMLVVVLTGATRTHSRRGDDERPRQRAAPAPFGARDGRWEWDLKAEHFKGTARIRPLLGAQGGWFEGVPAALAARLHPEDHERMRRAFDDHLRKRLPFEVEFRLRNPGGIYRWYQARGQASWDDDGKPAAMAGTLDDVTSRKRSEVRLRALIEAMPQIVWTASPAGGVDSWNGRWAEYTGLPRAGSLGDDWHKAVHPDDLPSGRDLWRKAVSAGTPHEAELRLKRTDGEYRWQLVRAVPVRDPAGHVVKWFGTFTDIDDNKRAEQAARVVAEAGAALGGLTDPIVGAQGLARLIVPRLADWCEVDLSASGVRTARASAATPLTVPEVPASVAEAAVSTARLAAAEALDVGRPVFQDGRAEGEHRAGNSHGSADPSSRYSVFSAPLEARGRTLGTLTLVVGPARRLTRSDRAATLELARLAALAVDNARLLRQTNEARLAAEQAGRAKDRFLAMLSHELRTPLTPALLAVTGLLDDPATPAEMRPGLDSARRGIALEARLVDDLLDVTRVASGKLQIRPERVDAHAVVRQAVTACAGQVRDAGLRLDLKLEAAGAEVEADPVRLQQVVWNLVKNATKFTPSGGTVTVATRRIVSRADTPDLVAVEVSDTGIGIEPELLARVFDVFEQGGEERRRRSGGLGLGLAISRSIAEAHGGRLVASSGGTGRGAQFTLELPAASVATSPRVGPAPKVQDAPWPKRILLVEDDDSTRKILARLLERRGSVVTAASGYQEALRASTDGPFDFVICDLGLPDGSGLDIPAKLASQGTLAALALTGYGAEGDVRRCRDAGFLGHLTKPVDFGALEAEIGRVLQAHEATRGT